MERHKTEHPQIEITQDVLNDLLKWGFEDNSWHNDTCARFDKAIGDKLFTIWIAETKPEDRESSDLSRYTLCINYWNQHEEYEIGEQEDIICTEKWSDIHHWVTTPHLYMEIHFDNSVVWDGWRSLVYGLLDFPDDEPTIEFARVELDADSLTEDS